MSKTTALSNGTLVRTEGSTGKDQAQKKNRGASTGNPRRRIVSDRRVYKHFTPWLHEEPLRSLVKPHCGFRDVCWPAKQTRAAPKPECGVGCWPLNQLSVQTPKWPPK